ncbi:restriction endonuclease [Echinicola soli]|uniref:Restriction endonuclease n=1 Tax=Echinicola soli TaxID=2591634 RepID=A0A514CNV4_9BACT|nr:restriction endonuclease [Echinicola soli]
MSVYEHQLLKVDEDRFCQKKLKALQQHYGSKGVKYYSLVHNGVKFNEHVGVIQVGGLTIEVLPKVDQEGEKSNASWKKGLIDMLTEVGHLKVESSEFAGLKTSNHSLLDLYFELFIFEMEKLLHQGLTKKYRRTEGNVKALKGSLNFTKHIQKNCFHKERFYVNHSVYDKEHDIHAVLYKALLLLQKINSFSGLHSRIGALVLNFPEMPDIRVSSAWFERLRLDRKTQAYHKALQIAKMILLNYHPDIQRGNNDVLAIMFDMNHLWEQFLFVSLRKHLGVGYTVERKKKNDFWEVKGKFKSQLEPDIIIRKKCESDKEEIVHILDAKWKRIKSNKPDIHDLRQMFAYHHYYNAEKTALVYPFSKDPKISLGEFSSYNYECSVLQIQLLDEDEISVSDWQKRIAEEIGKWMDVTLFPKQFQQPLSIQ